MINAGDSHIVSPWGKAVDPSSADVDLTTLFTGQAYARSLLNGSATPADIAVVYAGDTTNAPNGTAVTFKNVPSGAKIFGLFRTLKHANTTATNIVAEM